MPLVWLLAVTFTAGWQKMFDPDPRIGFQAQRLVQQRRVAEATQRIATLPAGDPAIATATKQLKAATGLQSNATFDLIVTGVFLAFAAALVGVTACEWIRLLRGTRPPTLTETEPVWLPESALRGARSSAAWGAAAIAVGLLREWSGEAAVDRAREMAATCACAPAMLSGGAARTVWIDVPEVRDDVERRLRQGAYVSAAEQRFDGVQRCC